MPGITSGIRSGLSRTAVAALALSTLFAGGCGEKVKPGKAEVQRQEVTGVSLAEAKPAQVDEYYETSGTVKAKNTAVISSRVIGTVVSLKVREGDRVSAGQLLMTIDDRDAAARVEAADAGHSEAQRALDAARQNRTLTETTYGRYKRLHDEKAISQQEMDEMEAKKRVSELEYQRTEETVRRARAGLEEAQVNRGFTRIKAPFPGVVTAKAIDAGSMAVPGAPLLTVEDPSRYRLELNADERLSGRIATGMPVEVALDALGQRMRGTVSEVVPAVDPVTRTFLVKIDLMGQGLRSGLYGKAFIPVGKKAAILVPRKAVVQKGELTGVYVVDGKGVMTYRLIRAGKGTQETVEVLSGIRPGEKIVVDGVERAVDGGVVKTAAR